MEMQKTCMELPTSLGNFQFWVWDGLRGQEPVALTSERFDPKKEVLLRIHSECLTGDTFHSLTCDCGAQKDTALRRMGEHGNGIFIYHRQEGRNLGLFKKVHAYNLMREGMDTHQANINLGGQPDSREFEGALRILNELCGGTRPPIRLLTNNPYKALLLERHGYRVIVEPLPVEPNIHNAQYVQTKSAKFLHGSIGYGPYAGVTLLQSDLQHLESLIALVRSFDLTGKSRKLFLGVALSQEDGDLSDEVLFRRVRQLHAGIADLKGVSIIFHVSYPETRRRERELTAFLEDLAIPFSLQVRMRDAQPRRKFDTDFLDSLHAEHLFFQLKDEQRDLLQRSEFVSYFSRSNRFVLIDQSWGAGVEAGEDTLREKVLALIERGICRIGVAGGFDAERAQIIFDLEDYFKIPVSVDAEAKLRTKGVIDLEKLNAYLAQFFPKAPLRTSDKIYETTNE